jgi:hypothetical protein
MLTYNQTGDNAGLGMALYFLSRGGSSKTDVQKKVKKWEGALSLPISVTIEL